MNQTGKLRRKVNISDLNNLLDSKFFIVSILIFLVFLLVNCDRSKTYYIDPLGNDTNKGTSIKSPWKSLKKVNGKIFKPGNKILFKAGGIWNGQLSPKGSGLPNNPIILGMYGKGAKPSINGNGISGLKAGTLLLYNQDYWEVENLDITNKFDSSDTRYGILVRWHNYGTGQHIHIRNCDIHDVNGSMEGRFIGDGILVVATGTEKQTNYNDVLIRNCSIKNVDRTGISIWSQWHIRHGMDYDVKNKELYHSSNGPYKASTNVVIRNNSLENTGGDGIIVSCTKGALIEYNIVNRANQRGTTPNAGIWPHNSDEAVMQYNEVYNTRYSGDGMGFDIDMLCNNCISQYNYSHNNEGGFHLICGPSGIGKTTGNIIRYNISQNDGNTVFVFAGNVDSTMIYNNTIYIGEELNTNPLGIWDFDGAIANNIFFYNNIIFNLGEGVYILNKSPNVQFKNNCFYGNHPINEPHDNYKIVDNPLFVNPGSGDIGRNTVDGYKLKSGSPCITNGKFIPNNGEKDYWQNPVSPINSPNIGAYNGTGK